MSFHFLSLTLRDWLVYEGEVGINFGQPRDGRNIWVIYGMNGYGKTSLLRAIQWLFHDRIPDRYIRDCFNSHALQAGRNELSVAAEFIYNGHHHHLIRRAFTQVEDEKAVGYPRTSVELSIDNQVQKHGIPDKIDQILPRECQQFFFFDGLEIEKYAVDVHTQETRDAIETVLGIPEIRNLAEDLGKLRQELERERDQLLQDQAEYQDLKDQKVEAENQLDAARQTLQTLLRKRESLQQQIERLRERADSLERVRDEMNDLRGLRRRRAELQERLDNYGKELQAYLRVVAERLVLPLLRDRLVQLETQVNKAARTTKQLTSAKAQLDLLKDLLHETHCVCGRELDDEACRALGKRLQDLENRVATSQRVNERTGSYGATIKEQEEVASRIRYIESLSDPGKIQGALLTKYKLQIELEEVEQDIALREKELEGKDGDIGLVFQTLGEKRQDDKSLGKQIQRAESDEVSAKKELEACEKALNEAALAIDDQRRVVDVLQLTVKAQNVAEDMIDGMLQLRREAIEKHMTNVFRMVTNKRQEYDRVEISEDFAPCIVTYNGQVMQRSDLSAGEKEVLAFSFIAGLNRSTETNAPLVMDTPFGHLDVQHRNGLLEALPKLPCQVILLATDRDLPPSELPNLRYCLGGRFDIERDELAQRSTIKRYE
jgi:DNA sulfur modification protein DndD